MSVGCGARSMVPVPIRSSIRYAASGSASVLLGKTLRSSTLRLAFVYIAVFGAAILGLFGFISWATLSYVQVRQERDIARERGLLAGDFVRGGRAGMIEAIERRLSGRPLGPPF